MPRYFEDWIDAYLDYSRFSEAPEKCHFWAAISTAAGALRRCVWMDMGYFEWTPCFYIVLVAPPGIVSKSTTIDIGMRLLRQVPGINFGPDAVTWQALAQSFAASTESFEYPPESQEYHPMSAITIASKEFGTFLNPNDREMVDMLVSLWDGQRGVWKKATKTSGDDAIENPWINIAAATTPAWIAGNFPEYMIGGGFTSRTIFVYAEEKRELVAYPHLRMPGGMEEYERKLVADLEYIAQLRGPMTLTPEAIEWGEAWYIQHYEKNRDSVNDRFAGYVARKQSHLHKVAMVLSATRRADLRITVKEMEDAEKALQGIESDMPKVFSQIGRTPVTDLAARLIEYLERNDGRLTDADVFNRLGRFVTDSDFKEALATAERTGKVKILHAEGKTYIQRIACG